jgi:hypothetical protein
MRRLIVVLVLLGSTPVALADEPYRAELGASVGLDGSTLNGGEASGIRLGGLYRPWRHVGVALDAYHFFLADPHDRHGLYTYNTATLSVRVNGAIGSVELFVAPGAGVAWGRYITGDTETYDRVQKGLGLGLRAGIEVPVARRLVLGTAGHLLVSVLDGAYGPEGNFAVELYGAFRF